MQDIRGVLERTLASLHGLRFKFVRTDACDADVKGKMPPSPATCIADYVRAPLYALRLTVPHGTRRCSGLRFAFRIVDSAADRVDVRHVARRRNAHSAA